MSPRARIRTASSAVVLVAVLLLAACSGSSDSKDYSFSHKTPVGQLIPAADRKPAQDVQGSLLSGSGTAKLVPDPGKVTLVNWFASWCGPCKIETPQLGLLYGQMHVKGVEFTGVDTKDDKGAGRSFVQQSKLTYPVVYDQQARAQVQLGNIPGVLPFTVLVDKQGRVAAVYITKLTPGDLRGPLSTLLAEK